MTYRNASAPARPVSRTLAAIAKAVGHARWLALAAALAAGTLRSTHRLRQALAQPKPAGQRSRAAAAPAPRGASPQAPARAGRSSSSRSS